MYNFRSGHGGTPDSSTSWQVEAMGYHLLFIICVFFFSMWNSVRLTFLAHGKCSTRQKHEMWKINKWMNVRAASEKNIRPAKLSMHASKSPHRQNNWCLWQVKWGTFEVQAHALYSSDHLYVDARVRFGSSTQIHESGTSFRRVSCWDIWSHID